MAEPITTVKDLILALGRYPPEAPIVSTGADQHGYAEHSEAVKVNLAKDSIWNFTGNPATVYISGEWR